MHCGRQRAACSNGFEAGFALGTIRRLLRWPMHTAEQWSAIGTVVSAIVAFLNLIVVIVLVLYNRKTMDILRSQSNDTNAQASIARETLAELQREKTAERGREFMRMMARLEDLNDNFLLLKHYVNTESFQAAKEQCPLKSDDWHTINAAVLELWPEGVEPLWKLERKLREIDTDLTLLSQPLDFQQAKAGTAHLESLLVDGHQTLLEVREGLMKHVK